jgi:hypothetical protein
MCNSQKPFINFDKYESAQQDDLLFNEDLDQLIFTTND